MQGGVKPVAGREEHAGERHLEAENPSYPPVSSTHEPIKSGDEPINEPINGPREPIKDPINPEQDTLEARVFTYIQAHPGKKRTDISGALGVSISTVKRALEMLANRIEYRGSKKTGGYYPK